MNLPTLHSRSVTLSIKLAKNPRGSSACRRDTVVVLVVAQDMIKTLTKINNHRWNLDAIGPIRWKIILSAALRYPLALMVLYYVRQEMARPEGFEPPTPRSVVWCSVQLSYGRANLIVAEREGFEPSVPFWGTHA
jgi:hypothetical protein